jgi:phosphate transport system permease protein
MAASELPRRFVLASGARELAGLAGEWSTTLATVLILLFLVVLVGLVAVNAAVWFWPAPVHQLTLADGTTLVGQLAGREAIPGSGEEDTGLRHRLRVKVGNRDLGGRDFVWVDEERVAARARPDGLVRVERSEYGDAFGTIAAATAPAGAAVDAADPVAVSGLLETGERLRDRQRHLQRQLERVRRPLSRLEERLDLVERSDRAHTPEARREAELLGAEIARLRPELEPRIAALEAELDAVRHDLDGGRVTLETSGRRLEVPLAHVVEVTWPNRMGPVERVLWAAKRLVLFLISEPREANTEGGIFPALFGTVLMVLLMSLAVVPLGVLTAVYMTEYAREGLPLRLAKAAVDNLAGVPSIVFGMFGLAFFIYGVGGSVDRTFFADRLPTPTFGTGGILWASLTLALLTVPVVVVATREGLLAVPRSWREGSLALGATRWQTLRRIVLPAAMPGILTGLILATSRAAGEVAPLMLTGAAKLAPSLPVDGAAPFLHLQRKFMHLGFHIYDVSMQSPNVEAAKPMAFATTAVLLVLVVLMNLTAIIIRRRLRRTYAGSAV